MDGYNLLGVFCLGLGRSTWGKSSNWGMECWYTAAYFWTVVCDKIIEVCYSTETLDVAKLLVCFTQDGQEATGACQKLKQEVINNSVCMTQSAWGSIWTLSPTWNTGWWQTVECAWFRADKKHMIDYAELKLGWRQATWYVWPREKRSSGRML